MKANKTTLSIASKPSYLQARSLLLVLSVLLAGFAIVGSSSATAKVNSVSGSVSVQADNDTVDPGGTIHYTITVQNGDQAGLVTVSDNLPPHTTLVDAPGCDAAGNGGSVQCTLAMFPFDTATLDVTVSVDPDVNCSNMLRDRAHVSGWPSGTADVEVTCAP